MKRKGLTPDPFSKENEDWWAGFDVRKAEREAKRQAALTPKQKRSEQLDAAYDERTRCMECGGLHRCDGDAPAHTYYTAADAARPPVTVSPCWRDPLVVEVDKNDDRRTE